MTSAFSAAAHHVRPHPKSVCPPAHRRLYRKHRNRFFNGKSFTGHYGFIDEKIFGFLNQAVSWNDIAGIQDDDVSGDNLFGRNLLDGSITKHGSFDSRDGKQLFHGVACTALLPKPKGAADEHN